MPTWLLIGSSPSVLDTLLRARLMHNIDRTITPNAGILLEPYPDVWTAVDSVAWREYGQQARDAQATGTRLVSVRVTGNWPVPEFHGPLKAGDFDEVVDVPQVGLPTASTWGCYRGSGVFSTEYAIRNGATAVLLLGCDGYANNHADYFDGRTRRTVRSLTSNLAERWALLARVFPDVAFIQYGQPRFTIDAPNWEVRQ